jgi:DNA-binding HxlR family transcriptional regulator
VLKLDRSACPPRDDVAVIEYRQYCPVALGSEVLAERWTPLILREMILGSTRFNEIERGLPGISRSLLHKRLMQLERRGVLERVEIGRGHEYHLTAAGKDLEGVLMSLGEWMVRWLYREPYPEEADPITLTWWMHRRVDSANAPDRRVVIQFDYVGGPPVSLWLILDRGEPSVCNTHPGFDPDLIVTADRVTMWRVFSGSEELSAARAAGRVRIDGVPALVSGFESWFLWSPFAPAVRARTR